jgi:hypothetical protein
MSYPHTELSAATSSTTWPSETRVPQGILLRALSDDVDDPTMTA